LPGTLEVTRRHLAESGLEDRIRLVPGDYRRDPLPSGFDVAFLSNIIHGEDEPSRRGALLDHDAALHARARLRLRRDPQLAARRWVRARGHRRPAAGPHLVVGDRL